MQPAQLKRDERKLLRLNFPKFFQKNYKIIINNKPILKKKYPFELYRLTIIT